MEAKIKARAKFRPEAMTPLVVGAAALALAGAAVWTVIALGIVA